mmetsp:Transcript_3137/g.10615  ORF Transcript_3137/g.10615 Transcript_3137/m.10615 type:complete len:230 (-) Transcript_3137:760-1449(-)
MPHPLLLAAEVGDVLRVGLDMRRHALHDAQAVAGEARELFGVVGHEAHVPDAEVSEDLGAGAVLARVDGQAEFLVGIQRVDALLLQRVGVDLSAKPDPSPLLPTQVQQYTAAVRLNGFEGFLELRPAVAPKRAKHVAGATLGMHAYKRRNVRGAERLQAARVGRFALHERNMLGAVDARAVAMRREPTMPCWHAGWRAGPLGDLRALPFIRHQVRGRCEGKVPLCGSIA